MTGKWKKLRPGVFELVLGLILALLLVMPALAESATLPGSFTVPLSISNLKISGIGVNTATITWETNGQATSQVYYDIRAYADITDYHYQKSDAITLVTQHKVVLGSLFSNTIYHCRLKSVTANAQTALSQDFSFTTNRQSGATETPLTTTPATPSPTTTAVTTTPPAQTTTPAVTTTTPAVPTTQPAPSTSPPPLSTPASPTPLPSPVVPVERVLAWIDSQQPPSALDLEGHPVALNGSFLILTQLPDGLYLIIPVALSPGSLLGSFSDAAGLTFAHNRLEVPAASAILDQSSLLVTGDAGTLGMTIVIETGAAVGSGDRAVAPIISIGIRTSDTLQDYTAQNAELGEVASALYFELRTLPDQANIKITTALRPDPAALTAFRLAAADTGLAIFTLAYTLNIEKTNLENLSDITGAVITMAVGRRWVENHGGAGAIRIIRYDPQTGTQQVLATAFQGYDQQGRAVFAGRSPAGLSVFGLVGSQPSRELSKWIVGLIILLVVLILFGVWYWIIRRAQRSRKNPPSVPPGPAS
jgi:hypothetical protein